MFFLPWHSIPLKYPLGPWFLWFLWVYVSIYRYPRHSMVNLHSGKLAMENGPFDVFPFGDGDIQLL